MQDDLAVPALSNHSRQSNHSFRTTQLKEESHQGGSDRNLQRTPSRRKSFLQTLTQLPTEDPFVIHPDSNEDQKLLPKRRNYVREMRLLCGHIVEAPVVQVLIVALIVANALLLGVATFDFVTDDADVEHAFQVVDQVFLVIFTIELFLQLCYRSLGLFLDGWLVFDFIIVVTSWSLESMQIIRAFRIFRAFRLITRVGALRELIMAIAAVMPRIYAIVMLLTLVFYIFAVLFTEMFGDLDLEYNYFGTLYDSLFTCMQLMTLEWADVARETMNQNSMAWLPFVAFISITGFIVFNLIVAVICDAVTVVDRQVKQEREGYRETDSDRLQEAQERIWELSETVGLMKQRHAALQHALLMLTKELTKPDRKAALSRTFSESATSKSTEYPSLSSHLERRDEDRRDKEETGYSVASSRDANTTLVLLDHRSGRSDRHGEADRLVDGTNTTSVTNNSSSRENPSLATLEHRSGRVYPPTDSDHAVVADAIELLRREGDSHATQDADERSVAVSEDGQTFADSSHSRVPDLDQETSRKSLSTTAAMKSPNSPKRPPIQSLFTP